MLQGREGSSFRVSGLGFGVLGVFVLGSFVAVIVWPEMPEICTRNLARTALVPNQLHETVMSQALRLHCPGHMGLRRENAGQRRPHVLGSELLAVHPVHCTSERTVVFEYLYTTTRSRRCSRSNCITRRVRSPALLITLKP